jgi:hypothetical protein
VTLTGENTSVWIKLVQLSLYLPRNPQERYRLIKKSLCTLLLQYNPHTIDDLKMAITEYIRNTDRAILNTDRAILNTDRAILNTDRAILNTDRAILNTDRAILNTDRAILNTVFENSVRRVNKCLETGGGQFEYYL